MAFKPLPIGVDDFEKLIKNGYYYVDKTLLIKELLDKKGEVNLFTRPRRFGKTLGLSMIRCFFENVGDDEGNLANRNLFQGLRILEAGETYTDEMNRYPVISLSLKSAKQPEWELAYGCLKEEIGREYFRHRKVMASLDTSEQRRRYEAIMNQQGNRQDFITSIRFLCDCLYQHYGQHVIILIDEYDVPLENSYFEGFYEEMIGFIRSVFESALKSNPGLEFAVITGCLRITKESIFTGLNNLKMNSILSANYDEYFGFLQEEVNQMADFYGIEANADMAVFKDWYDGYTFGTKEVYNPWSVINQMEAMYVDRVHAWPSPHWANTSSNRIVKTLVERAELSTKDQLEQLIEGGTIEKPIHEDITYEDIEKSEDNLWNFLFFTGYLTMCGRRAIGGTPYVTMTIPNDEVRYIYKTKILDWFWERMQERNLQNFYDSIARGNAAVFQKELTQLLRESISFYDNKEAFYHGFMLGLLERVDGYAVSSNQESGDGRYDIMLKSPDITCPVLLFELKISDSYHGLEAAAQSALAQMEMRHYGEGIRRDGYSAILYYGVAFYKKNCFVLKKSVDNL